MDFEKFKIPSAWPKDCCEFAHSAITEISQLKLEIAELKNLVHRTLTDVLQLEGSLKKVMAENTELKSKLKTNSSNSSLPPSKDPPHEKPAPKDKPPSGRKRGGQNGHKGKGRILFSPEKISEYKNIFPDVCPHCSSNFNDESKNIETPFTRFHQIDIPENIGTIIVEYRLHTCKCSNCCSSVTAHMPPEKGNTVIGVNMKSLMAVLSTRYHLSKRLIRELLIDMFGEDAALSIGCISQAEEEVANSLEKPYNEAISAIKIEEAINVDETSWYLNHNLQWIWVAVSDTLAVFHIDPNRSQKAFERFLGDFQGFIMSDRFSAYNKLSLEQRQLCWAHLKRDFQKLIDRENGAEGTGRWALSEIEKMFGFWHSYLDGKLAKEKLEQEFQSLKARFMRLLKLGQETKDPKANTFCGNIIKAWSSLWNFVKRPEMLKPTNNRAEQTIRPSVIQRLLSLGSQSIRGLRYTERMLTVAVTLRKQGRGILSFIRNALIAFRTDTKFPCLLPVPSG